MGDSYERWIMKARMVKVGSTDSARFSKRQKGESNVIRFSVRLPRLPPHGEGRSENGCVLSVVWCAYVVRRRVNMPVKCFCLNCGTVAQQLPRTTSDLLQRTETLAIPEPVKAVLYTMIASALPCSACGSPFSWRRVKDASRLKSA